MIRATWMVRGRGEPLSFAMLLAPEELEMTLVEFLANWRVVR